MSVGPEKDDPTYEITCCVDPARVRARDAGGDVAAGVCRGPFQPDLHGQHCVLQSRYGEGHRRPAGLHGLGLRLGPELPGWHRFHGQQEQLPGVCARIRARPSEQVQRRDQPHSRGQFSATNPFTPDILVFNQNGQKIAGPLAKPTAAGVGLLPHGPSVGIAFENGFQGGRLFVTDSNQAMRSTPPSGNPNNSSRIVLVDPNSGVVTPFITGLPTGDHPAEQMAFKAGWIYWSQGSTTNSGVVGRDNGGGLNQQDIPCQDITLSNNVFDSGGGVKTSGYSPFGTQNPGGTVQAFTSATGNGICDGAILRAKINVRDPKLTIEPVSWGYRNPYGLRFAPNDHPLKGGLFV